ncbi:MAG: hypothetical protein Q8K58_14480 [Acidimicrobiales bacterium]|nr:hypothetical protein [Acidimicrobiales bacterium]
MPGCEADLAAAHAALAWDGLFIAGYVLLLTALIRRWWPLIPSRRVRRAAGMVAALPAVAGLLDVVENTLIWVFLTTENGTFAFSSSLRGPVVIATIAWLKWLTALTAVVCGGVAVMVAATRRHEPDQPPRDPDEDEDENSRSETQPVEDAALGVCCSGGGIRAAAFSLGALEELEERNVLSRARWLTAVSGGAYAATAWRLVKADCPDEPAARPIIDWLRHPIEGSPAGRHRFLRNGPGGLGRPALAALTYIAFNIAVLAALVWAVAWPVGWLLGSDAVQPELRRLDNLPSDLHVAAENWLPGLLVLGLALFVLLCSAAPSWRVATLWRISAALVVAAVILEVLLVGAPLLMVTVGRWLTGGTNGLRTSIVGTSALLGAAVTVARIATRPLIGKLTSRLPELGGLLLAVVALVWGGKVATDAAVGAGTFRHQSWWIAVTIGFLAVYLLVGVTQISIHRIYRKRLRRTFGLARNADGQLHSPPQPQQRLWTAMPDDNPELVICCAQQRTGIAPGGLPAESFTISGRHVRIGEHVIPTTDYVTKLNGGLAVERYVSSWIATTGAAFASAMGRLSKGSTNALLAALNVDLGIWLPNPRLVQRSGAQFPKVRLAYLFKEILGVYDPADRYVFVADGGHWENLGLVELLRKRCSTIVCIDASGDDAAAFTTLRQAVELASLELPDTVASIDLTGLEAISPTNGAMPGGIVAKLNVTYVANGNPAVDGLILYAKAQLASNLDIALRRFAKADRRFPNYSTGNQFLSDRQFDQLVALGRAAGIEVTQQLSSLSR